MKFDNILTYLGEFGPYQKRLFLIVCLPAISNAFLILLPVFIFAIPAHRCAIPSLPNDTYAVQGSWHQDLINHTIPTTENGWDRCYIYSDDAETGNKTKVNCNKWVYDMSQYESTYMTEHSLVCGKEIYRSHANLAVFAGKMVGALILGPFSDVIGRKKILMLSIITRLVGGIGTAFASNFFLLLACRFLVGVSSISGFLSGYVICMELVGPSKRKLAGNIIMLFWALGLFILVFLAYFIRDWKTLTLATSIPAVGFLSYWWLLPESPRWLISKGKLTEARDIIQKAAKVNKVKLPETIIDQLSLDENNKTETKVTELFTDARILITTLIVFLNWFVVNMVYYGLSLNVTNLSGDHYLNFTIASIAETLSYVLCICLLDVVGRKALHCFNMLLGGLSCMATIFPVLYGDESNVWITTGLAMIGKLGASGAFATIYVFTAEIFPTVVRNSGLGTSSTCSQVGGMLSPYIADLGVIVGGDLRIALPLIVIGSLAVAAGLLALLLPETLNRKLAETVADMKNMSRKREIEEQPEIILTSVNKRLTDDKEKSLDDVDELRLINS